MKNGIVTPTGIEKAICATWNHWDEIGTMTLQFYDCTLTPAVLERIKNEGINLQGDTNFCVTMNLSTCVVQIHGDEDSLVIELPISLAF